MFDLINKDIDKWKETQFWLSDSMNNGNSLQKICLYVNWQKREVEVETVMNTNSFPTSIFNRLAYRYNIPVDTDFTQFKEFYESDIKPILEKMFKGYEIYWDGSNHKGRFSEEVRELDWEVEQKLRGAPQHDIYYAFDIHEAFETRNNLVEYLNSYQIDFINSDLDNDAELDKIIDAIMDGEVVILNMDKTDYKKELKEIQLECRGM